MIVIVYSFSWLNLRNSSHAPSSSCICSNGIRISSSISLETWSCLKIAWITLFSNISLYGNTRSYHHQSLLLSNAQLFIGSSMHWNCLHSTLRIWNYSSKINKKICISLLLICYELKNRIDWPSYYKLQHQLMHKLEQH